MTHTSQGNRVPERDDFNYTSFIGRLLLLKSNRDESEDSSGSNNENVGGNDNMSKITANFLLKLVNETFLSLPIIDCKSINQIQVAQHQDYHSLGYDDNDANQNYHDACFIDWSNAKLVQNPAKNEHLNYSNLKNQASEILLSNLFESNSILKSPELSSLTNFASKHLNDNISNKYDASSFNTTNSSTNSYYHLAKLTYLSISTILSICGALINLFIIFIIIFNTKQKRISLIRGNTIGQNNLLLFQLTLTGLLLAGYVLIDNFSIQYESKTWNNVYSQSFSQSTRTTDLQDDNLSSVDIHKYTLNNQQQDEVFQRSIRNDISPLQLSSFLPPTLFFSNNKLLCNIFDRNVVENNLRTQFEGEGEDEDEDEDENDDDDDTYETANDYQLHGTSLIFIFNRGRSFTSSNDLNGNDNNESLVNSKNISKNFSRKKIWYLDAGGDGLNLIDLHDILKSIFIADSNCNSLEKERKARQTYSSSQERQQEPARVPIYLNFNINYSNMFIKLYILSLISFLMNVFASVHIWTVAALAYDRYCAIAHPFQYLRSIHASRTKTFLVISWTLSIILNILFPVFMNQINKLGLAQQVALEPSYFNRHEAEEDWFTWSNLSENSSDDNFENVKSIANDERNHGYSNKKECQFMIKRNDQQRETKFNRNLDKPHYILEEFLKYRSDFYDGTFREYDSLYNENIYLEQLVKREKLKMKFVSSISIKFVELSSKLIKIQDSIQKKLDNIRINQTNRTSFIALLIVFSLFSFVIIILIPLLIISVCNISIYRIVKVHERRLSVSSANNNSTSVSNTNNNNNNTCNNCSANTINNQRFNHNFKKQGIADDEKAEANSVTSLLFNRLFGANFAQKTSCEQETTSYIQDQEGYDFQKQNKCLLRCDKDCDCEKLASNKLEYYIKSESQPNIVNRSKRLISRRDSYQVLTRSNGEELRDKADEEFGDKETICTSKTKKKVSSSCDSILFGQNQQSNRTKLKRKVSDNVPLCNSRKSSNTSHTEELDVDNRSYINTPITMYFDGIKYESGSIMNQLKMAGLSFAGIAIRKSFGHRNNLHNSCSICNIYKQEHCQHGSSISRCSVETTSTANYYKQNRNSSLTYKYQDNQNNKFACQLADNDSDNMQHVASNANLIFHPHNGRLPSTFGTKSSAFNVVIWLILTMLLLALPHFLLVTVDRVARLNMSKDIQLEQIGLDQNELKLYTQQLNTVLRFIMESKIETSDGKISDVSRNEIASENGCKDEQSIVQLSSLWLSCLCRILFLSMVPLNGWLYGIKSRSLRTKIRIVLKRYINEKQASIEINKRQRSVSSMRSRDSSFANLQSINSYQSSHCNCNINRPDRSFRRCSSFGTSTKHTDSPNYLKNARSLQGQVHLLNCDSSEVVALEGPTKIPNDPSIKLVIEDEYNADNSCSINQPQSISVNSSPTSSRRSILSTNASTIKSNSQVAIQSSFEQKCSNSHDSEENSFNQLHLESKFSDILNKSEVSDIDSNTPILNKSPKSIDTEGGNEHGTNITDDSNALTEEISNGRTFLTGTANNQVPRHVRLHGCSSGGQSCNYESVRVDRRHSNSDLSNSKQENLLNNSEARLDKSIKRSNSDFKLIVGPVEQRLEQFNGFGTNLEEGLLDKKSSIDSSRCTDDRTYQSNFVKPVSKKKSLRTLSSWCMELRQSLTKVISSASAAILNTTPSADPTIEDGQFSAMDFDSCRCELTSRGSIDSNLSSQDQSRVGLLKRACIENDCHTNSTYNWFRNLPHPNNVNKSQIRTSYTMNTFDMKAKRYEDCAPKCHCPNHQTSHSKGCFCEKTKRSNSSVEKSQTFLKPPSFLKLIFDPNNPAATYSSSSALSPIKECSSNQHSYASSQSSLNNSQTQQHRKLSLNNLSSKASLPTNATLVTLGGGENKFETRLVKDVEGE